MQSQYDLLELLKSTRKRIENPSNWTQNAFARNADGKKLTHSDSAEACSWCLEGALDLERSQNYRRVSLSQVLLAFRSSIPDYYERYYHNAVLEFNDSNTHGTVLGLLDKVIDSVSHELSMA